MSYTWVYGADSAPVTSPYVPAPITEVVQTGAPDFAFSATIEPSC